MISKIAIAVFVFVMSFIAYNKSSNQIGDNTFGEKQKVYQSSVIFDNEKYVIDSAIIRNDINKNLLLSCVQTESLAVKSNKEGVPDFIWSFLNSIAYGGKFEIVNPGEEWKCGIVNFGHTVLTKTYDANSKDTIWTISGDGAVLPNKQFVYFGIGKNIALFSYYASGFNSPVQNVVMIKFQDKKIIDFWYRGFNYGNVTEDGDTLKITTKAEIIKMLMAKQTGGC